MILPKMIPYIAQNKKRQAQAKIGQMLLDFCIKGEKNIGSTLETMEGYNVSHGTIKKWILPFISKDNDAKTNKHKIVLDEFFMYNVKKMNTFFDSIFSEKKYRLPLAAILQNYIRNLR